jgi:phage terminase large subunit-like protein
MLKSAFRVFITMVDGEPRIGFFKDKATTTPYKLFGAISLENPVWENVDYIATDDTSSASTLPLYWVKPKPNVNDTKVYRFFKLSVESK